MLVHTSDTTIRELIREEFDRVLHPTSESELDDYEVSDEVYDAVPRDSYPFGDPVAVQIVTDKPTIVVPRGSVQWVGEKTVISNSQPQMIVGKNPYRRTVILVNIGTLNVAIHNTQNIRFGGTGKFGAIELRPGDSLTLDTTAEIWALSDPASQYGEVNICQIVETGHDT